MADKDSHDTPWYLAQDKPPRMWMWILGEMTKGAGIAAAIFFGAVFFIFILIAIRGLLPEDPYAATAPVTTLSQLA